MAPEVTNTGRTGLVADLDPGAAVLGRVEDRVGDGGGAAAILKGDAVWVDVAARDDDINEVVELVDEGVSQPTMWPCGRQTFENGRLRLEAPGGWWCTTSGTSCGSK